MTRRKNITGEKIGNVFVMGFSHIDNGGNSIWNCKCACGKEYKVSYTNFRRSAGVGCVECKNIRLRKLKTHHGMSDTRIHNIWMHMIDRCEKPFTKSYADYGARGIIVCEEWHDFVQFYKWAMQNGYNESLTIDRIDVDGHYNPSNCRWVNRKVQNNNRRNTKYYTINEIKHTLSEWCDIYEVNYSLVKLRLKRGVGIEVALTTPIQKPFGFRNLHDNPELIAE